MTDTAVPCVSSQAYDLAVIGFVLGIAGMCLAVAGARLIYTAARRLRSARLGDALLAACDDDAPTAEKVVATARAENEIMGDIITRGLRFDADYPVRLARFNQACRDHGDGGPRWQDVQ